MTPKEIEDLFSGEGWSISRKDRYSSRAICFRGFRVAEGLQYWSDHTGAVCLFLYPPGLAIEARYEGENTHPCSRAEVLDVIRGYVEWRRDRCYARNERRADLATRAMEALEDLKERGPRPRQLGRCVECRAHREKEHRFCPHCGQRHNGGPK